VKRAALVSVLALGLLVSLTGCEDYYAENTMKMYKLCIENGGSWSDESGGPTRCDMPEGR
jgi:hypothetical protein